MILNVLKLLLEVRTSEKTMLSTNYENIFFKIQKYQKKKVKTV